MASEIGRNLLFNTLIMFSHYAMIRLVDLFILIATAKNLTEVSHSFAYSFAVLIFWYLILLFLVSASVHSSFEANYAEKVLSLKEMLLGVCEGRWRRALTTSIWIIIITSLSLALYLFVVEIIIIIGASGEPLKYSDVFGILASVIVVSAGCYIAYLCSLMLVSFVVSVIEDESSGVFSFLQSTAPATENAKLTVVIDLAISIPESLAFCMWILFAFVVYTLFYHECKVRKTAASYDPIAVVGDL